MLHIDCICVGKLKEDYLKNAILEYSKRLSKYCIFNIIELQDEKVPTNLSEAEKTKIIEKESNNILANIKDNSYVIALDLTGKQYTSEGFSKKITQITNYSSHITFLIGGTLGMSKTLLSKWPNFINNFHLSYFIYC